MTKKPKCEICNEEFKTLNGMAIHVKRKHNIEAKDYYDKYMKIENEEFCLFCGKITKFKNMNLGYQKYCNLKCSNNDPNRKQKFKESYLSNDMEQINNKRKKTNLKRYGNENANLSDIVKNKTKDIFIEKFGVDNPMKLEKYQLKSSSIRQEKFINNNIPRILEALDLKLLSEYKGAHIEHSFECIKCLHQFNSIWNYIQQGKRCPKCFPNGTSSFEDDLINYLNSININNIQRNCKTLIRNIKTNMPLELDIYIPDKKVAIEFNGLYWHSEKFINDKNYHLNKLKLCEEKDVFLITIFEDEWLSKQDIVKSRLKQILQITNSQRIHARKCQIKEIDSKVKNEFLEKYHIQGNDSSVIKLGAFYNDELVSVMTFAHGNISKGSKYVKDIWELNRFAINNDYRIPGIASKLLKYFQRNYEWNQIFSYSDRRWSQGNVYYKLGFELDSITKPNYWYLKQGKRIHRFNLRKTSDEPKDITEWLLRKEQGYDRIWDCGNLKFILNNNNLEAI